MGCITAVKQDKTGQSGILFLVTKGIEKYMKF